MTSHPPEPQPNKRLRVSDSDRDAVIALLNKAHAEGRLDVAEFDERMNAALAAKTFGDLDVLVEDLPVPAPSAALAPRGAATPIPGSALGWNQDNPLVLRASWDNDRRDGRWAVPPFIRLEPVAADARVNFLEVENPPLEIDVLVTAGMGTATVVVPADWGVNVDALEKNWGAVRNKANTIPGSGKPLVRVRGGVGMATFTARLADYFERRKLERNQG